MADDQRLAPRYYLMKKRLLRVLKIGGDVRFAVAHQLDQRLVVESKLRLGDGTGTGRADRLWGS
jgi:hypothetical protein